MNPLPREYVMFALFGAGLETRLSSRLMAYAKRIPEAMGAARSKKDSSEVRS
jgi:hypothetical protein